MTLAPFKIWLCATEAWQRSWAEAIRGGIPHAVRTARRARPAMGQRPSDKKAKKVLVLHKEGLSYRLIGRNVGLSKNTVMEIVRRSE
jgi:DNA-directed RNA polymerase specialized sigma24 family protein